VSPRVEAIAAVERIAARAARAEQLLRAIAAANTVQGDGEVFVRLTAETWSEIQGLR
jgi:hypothetical protein